MYKISLDTNAVLDFCYRTYPENIFPKLWDEVEALCLGNFIKFHVCESVLTEIHDKILQYQWDDNVFEEFSARFNLLEVKLDDHGQETLDIKSTLVKLPASANSKHVQEDNYADIDVVSLCKFLKKNSMVITCEQGVSYFNWSNPKHKAFIKVPSICEKFGLDCGGWPFLFEKLGLKFT